MEREVGGGIGMGNTCKPKAISLQCMTKFTTKKKKIIKKNKIQRLLNSELSTSILVCSTKKYWLK